MLTDVALKALRPKEKPYKVTDRDGMYVLVSTKGALSFRLDYRLSVSIVAPAAPCDMAIVQNALAAATSIPTLFISASIS